MSNRVVDDKGLKFLTAINFTKRELTELNSMTFFFDPNWKIGTWNRSTLPLAFFHVRNQQEVMDTDISQKQIIIHKSGGLVSPTSSTGALTNVIADNIVIKPKIYKLDVLVPYSPLGLSLGSGVLNQYQINGVNAFLAGDGNTNDPYTDVTAWTSQVSRGVEIVKDLILDFVNAGARGYVADVLTNITSVPDYNKNSMEAMWLNRSLLKMKTWNDWRFKYVAIKNIDLHKNGTDDGVYEGTITVQEVPILTLRGSLTGKEVRAGGGNPDIIEALTK